MAQISLLANNIKCSGCADTIRTGLIAFSGVDNVKVEIDTGTVTILGEQLDAASLFAALSEMGYPVSKTL